MQHSNRLVSEVYKNQGIQGEAVIGLTVYTAQTAPDSSKGISEVVIE